MTHYIKYIRKYWRGFTIAVLFLTFEAIGDLLQPTIMAKIIDVGVAGNDLPYVLKMGGLMLLITLFGVIAASTRSILATQVSQRFGADLRLDLFRKIQHLSFENSSKFDKASLVTRLTSDVSQVQMFVNGLMRIFVKAPLLCIGGLIMATRLDAKLAIVLAVIVPVVAILIFLHMRIGFPRFIGVQKALDRVNGTMREYLSGVRVVKAFNRFGFEVDKFNEVNEQFQLRSIRAMRIMVIFGPLIALTLNFGIIAVLWIGGLRVEAGNLQVGVIIAFINYMTQILFSLMMISMVFNMFVRAKASAGRISEVLAEENRMTWSNSQPIVTGEQGSIAFEQVTFSYTGSLGEAVLKDITFSCRAGETIGIIGSTGSGKSSLVGLIPRFYDADAGTVKVNGVDVRTIDPHILREKIAIVPQKATLFTGTIIDNLLVGKQDASLAEMQQAAKIAAADVFISAFPEGYETVLGQGGVNLSGGQKQRLSIARALVRKPQILILDDSTSAVDAVTEANIRASLRQYAKGLTTIIIGQRITSVMDADTILVLDQGRIVGSGTHDHLLRHCQVYQEIYQSQIGKEVV